MMAKSPVSLIRPKTPIYALLVAMVGIVLLSGCVNRISPTATDRPVAPSAGASASGATIPAPMAEHTFQPDQMRLATAVVVDGLDTPVYVTHAGDGSSDLYVLEKVGKIRVVRDGSLVEEPFLDISDRVTTGGNEQGLLGLAFAPDYMTSGTFFVHYSDNNGDTVIARYQSTGAAAIVDPASESIVLQLEQPARNHNGGMLAFGPDGYLYIGLGDGGGSGDRYGNGQNPDTLLGKLLRLDLTDPTVPYDIPADNPWTQATWNGADARDEIWAMGLRNPWRFSFDRATGDLWIGDVGQNQYEEVNFLPIASGGGANFGWPVMEATHCYQREDCDGTDLIAPVAEYSHAGHCSVTGGYVYRGEAMPTLNGIYLYGDYCSGVIWGVWSADGLWQSAELLRSDAQISSFGEDHAGELYVTDMGSGQLLRLIAQSE